MVYIKKRKGKKKKEKENGGKGKGGVGKKKKEKRKKDIGNTKGLSTPEEVLDICKRNNKPQKKIIFLISIIIIL